MEKYGIPCEHAIASLQRFTIEEIQQMVNYKLTSANYRNAF